MRPLLVLLFATTPACDGGILTIPDKDPADLFDSFTDDRVPQESATSDTDEDSDDGDTAADLPVLVDEPTVRCFDRGGGVYDRILTADVPMPERVDWTRVHPPDVLAWRASESCWDDQAVWSTGTEGPAGAHPDGSPGGTYTLTVTTDTPCDQAQPITLGWACDQRDGNPITYAVTGDTEPVCT